MAGRFAPSPSGDLHLGNVRTALLAWAYARSTGRRFVLRVEDIDTQRSHAHIAQRQLEDLRTCGLNWDGPVLYQHTRSKAYAAALEKLPVYECYCSRKDIAEASRAPHAMPGQYPGTCRDLTEFERIRKREDLAGQGRVPALRVRAQTSAFTVHDHLVGDYTGVVDDFIVRRGGPVGQPHDWAYNLAVVVDDAAQGVDQVVRGEDLLSSAPRQAYLAQVLGYPVPTYIHVPLMYNAAGQRLSKRDSALTLRQVLKRHTVAEVIAGLAASVGVGGSVRSAAEFCEGWAASRGLLAGGC